jgi:hypothetical protein
VKKSRAFAKESDLCAAFIDAIGKDWTSYAETAGWDILLVRNADGFQIGIQAKLKLNPFVLAQTLDEYQYEVAMPGPDCRAVLVPWDEVTAGLTYLSAYVGVTVIRMLAPKPEPRGRRDRSDRFEPSLRCIARTSRGRSILDRGRAPHAAGCQNTFRTLLPARHRRCG